jgi:hypothetical protein
MGRCVRVAWSALVASLTACGTLVAASDDDTGGDAGGPRSDGVAPGPDAPDGAAVRGPFCILHASALFCADFDTPNQDVGAGFGSDPVDIAGGGLRAIDDSESTSPPASFLATAPADTGTVQARLCTNHSSVPPRKITLGFDMKWLELVACRHHRHVHERRRRRNRPSHGEHRRLVDLGAARVALPVRRLCRVPRHLGRAVADRR